jgi:thioredoxin 1
MIKITESNFDDEVTHSIQPVMLDFGATWCGPCKMIEPVLQKLETSWQGKVMFGKVDVDESPDLAMRYQVMGVPTVILFEGGEIKERISGYMPEKRLMDKFGPHLNL